MSRLRERGGARLNQSVLRAIAILELFVEHKELSLQQITDKTKLPKPTAYRLLSTLTSKGLLYKVKEHVHDSRYRLGTKLLQLGHLVAERIELREIALPYMEQLAASINEVVHLVIPNNEEATYIEKVNSTRALSLQTKIGRSIPLYIGSGPKMLLAFLSVAEQERILNKKELFTLTNRRINKEKLLKELEEIRTQHFSMSIEEQDPDTTGISFPIFNYEAVIVGAIAISGLSSRFTGEKLMRMIEHGRKTAEEISKQLGYRG